MKNDLSPLNNVCKGKNVKNLLIRSLKAGLLFAGLVGCASDEEFVPGSRALTGDPCASADEPGRLCINETDRCPGGGYAPSRMACRSGTWRCLRDPIGSCEALRPETFSCREGTTNGTCDLGFCSNNTPVPAINTCVGGQFHCLPVAPGCPRVEADAGIPDAGSATDTGGPVTYNGPCQPGETRHCYSGPSATENRGQCHGSTQACLVSGHNTAWSPDCVGEVTPSPFGDQPQDGIDNNCDGWVDNQHPNFDRFGVGGYCEANRGCFWFCDAYDNAGSDQTGYRGCCTSGRFRSLDGEGGAPHSGMLLKGSGGVVYYYGADRRRHVFPTTSVLASWFGAPNRDVPMRRQASTCGQVFQIRDADLAAIAIGDNVTMRPGSMFTGITTHPRMFVITRGRILRQLMIDPSEIGLAPAGAGDRIALMPDAFFINYSAGINIERASDYDAAAEYNTTIDRELGLQP